MTPKQTSDLNSFLEQAKEKTLDSLDFAQMLFTIEEVVGGNPNYNHPILGELNAYLAINYPDRYRDFLKDLDAPAYEVMTGWYNKLIECEAYEVGVGHEH